MDWKVRDRNVGEIFVSKGSKDVIFMKTIIPQQIMRKKKWLSKIWDGHWVGVMMTSAQRIPNSDRTKSKATTVSERNEGDRAVNISGPVTNSGSILIDEDNRADNTSSSKNTGGVAQLVLQVYMKLKSRFTRLPSPKHLQDYSCRTAHLTNPFSKCKPNSKDIFK